MLHWICNGQKFEIYNNSYLYVLINTVNFQQSEYFKQINGNKYLTLVPTNENKKKLQKYEKQWSKIIDLIRSIAKNSDDYDEKYMEIKFNK